ncbi:endonuclease domain-containing protein [Geobacter sp. 60473]|uniref:endonuclease domain-containing protein n=1 Tax=Geobacter sp. 60473 TaxID=3080755 RepID=UPI002B2CF4B0|nr:endonuclease domain-containing protein [Geobacter sp. 60473]
MKTYTKSLIPRARDMRSNMTEPEKRMWYQCLKHLPLRFRRQRPVGPYIVDFYCAELKLVIEIDGAGHATDEGIVYDAGRTAFLEGLGLRVIRFGNHEVMNNIEGVFESLQKEVRPPSIPPIP